MLKKVCCVCFLLTLVACDKFDISEYPENVQNCYYENISDDNNCTTNKKRKKITVKFCACIIQRTRITKVTAQGRFAATQKIRNECAKKTGYAFCEKNKTESQ